MGTTAWLNISGDNLASNNENWSRGCPDDWNEPFFDLHDVVRITWDIRSFFPSRYSWEGDPNNLVVSVEANMNLAGSPWVPSWVLALVQQNGVSARIDTATLAMPPPMPTPDFETSGDGVYCPDGNYELIANQQNWTVWARFQDFVFPQTGTDRYWVDAAEGGASVPGAGENVFFENHASETGVWNATTNWKASVGVAAAGAYTCDIDVDTAVIGTLTMNYASATLTDTGDWNFSIGGTISLANGTMDMSGIVSSTLDMNTSMGISSGALIAPAAGGILLFSGLLWTDAGAFTHSNGEVTFDRSGSQTTLGGNSTQFYDVYVADACGLALDTMDFVAARNVTLGTGTSGTVTTSTGTKRVDGALTINAGGSFGTAATTYTLDLNGTLAASAGTLIAPQAAGAFTFSGATWNMPTVFTTSSGKVTFDLAGTTSLGTACSAANRTFYKVTIDAGATLDTVNASGFGLTASNVVSLSGVLTCRDNAINLASTVTTAYGLTIAAGGVFTGGSGTHTIGSISSNTATSSCTMTSGTATINGKNTGVDAPCILLLAASTWSNGAGTIAFTTTTSTSVTLGTKSLNIVTMALGAVGNRLYIAGASAISGTLLVTSGTFYPTNALGVGGLITVDGGVLGAYGYAFTMTSGITISGGTVNYISTGTIDCNGPFLLSSGTYSHTVATTSTFSGATFTQTGGTLTASAGTTTFDGGATAQTISRTVGGVPDILTLFNVATSNVGHGGNTAVTQGSGITATWTLTIAASTTWTTTATNYALTAGNVTALSGALTCNNSIISLGSGLTVSAYTLTVNAGATFAGGTGAHIIGSLNVADNATANCTMTSGICTINGYRGVSIISVLVGSTSAFAHGNGTVTFTYEGAHNVSCARNLYNVTVNAAANAVTQATAITMAGTFAITLGLWSTSVTNYALTVTGTSSITGTLTCNASALSLGSTLTTAYGLTVNAGGVFTGGTGAAHTIGSISSNTATSSCTLTSGTTTINAAYSDAGTIYAFRVHASSTFAHGSGTLTLGTATATHYFSAGWQSLNNFIINASNWTTYINTDVVIAGNLSKTNIGATQMTVAITVTVNGTSTFTAGTFGAGGTAYLLDMNGSLLASTGGLTAPTAAGSFTFAGAVWNTPTTFTAGTGTVWFDSVVSLGNASTQFNHVLTTAPLTTSGFAVTCANMTIGLGANNGSITCGASVIDANGTVSITAGSHVVGGTSSWAVSGNWDNASTSVSWDAGTSTITFDGGVAQAVNNSTRTFYNASTATALTAITQGSAIVALGAFSIAVATTWTTTATNYALTVTGATTASGGLTCNGSAIDIASFTTGADAGYLVMGSSSWTVSGSFYKWGGSGLWDSGTSTVNLDGTLAQSLDLGYQSFNNLIISNSGVVDIVVVRGLWLTGYLNATSVTARLDMFTNSVGATVPGSITWANGFRVLSAATGTGSWQLTGVGTYTDGNATPVDMNDLTFGGTTTLANNIQMAYMNVTSTVNCGNKTLFIDGTSCQIAFSFNYQTSTVYLNGTAAQIVSFEPTGSGVWNLTIANTAAADLITFLGDVEIHHDLHLIDGLVNFDGGPSGVWIEGDYTVDAGVTVTNIVTPWTFNGVALQVITVPAGDFNIGPVAVAAGASAITTYRLHVTGVKTGVTSTLGPPVMDRLVVNGAMTINPLGAFWHAPEYAAGGGSWEWWLA